MCVVNGVYGVGVRIFNLFLHDIDTRHIVIIFARFGAKIDYFGAFLTIENTAGFDPKNAGESRRPPNDKIDRKPSRARTNTKASSWDGGGMHRTASSCTPPRSYP